MRSFTMQRARPPAAVVYPGFVWKMPACSMPRGYAKCTDQRVCGERRRTAHFGGLESQRRAAQEDRSCSTRMESRRRENLYTHAAAEVCAHRFAVFQNINVPGAASTPERSESHRQSSDPYIQLWFHLIVKENKVDKLTL
ncbi:hypothetical protein MRX96_032615 [Rhipicephalus microplus]